MYMYDDKIGIEDYSKIVEKKYIALLILIRVTDMYLCFFNNKLQYLGIHTEVSRWIEY